MIQLSAPTSAERVRVEKLLVKERDKVRSEQVIAILDNQDRLQVALKQAKQQVKVALDRISEVRPVDPTFRSCLRKEDNICGKGHRRTGESNNAQE